MGKNCVILTKDQLLFRTFMSKRDIEGVPKKSSHDQDWQINKFCLKLTKRGKNDCLLSRL